MDEQAFRHYLKQRGKKTHVVDGLINQLRVFQEYLTLRGRESVDDATEADLKSYAAELGSRKTHLRGLMLYYGFVGNARLTQLAGEMREQETAKSRRIFRLRDFRGVDTEVTNRLEAAGIANVEQMLATGNTPDARHRLAEQTGIPLETIVELVKLSDLSRLGAVKGIRARLYYDAGLDTPAKFTEWDADALLKMLQDFVARTGFDGIAPLPKELRNAIATARKLVQVVEY